VKPPPAPPKGGENGLNLDSHKIKRLAGLLFKIEVIPIILIKFIARYEAIWFRQMVRTTFRTAFRLFLGITIKINRALLIINILIIR